MTTALSTIRVPHPTARIGRGGAFIIGRTTDIAASAYRLPTPLTPLIGRVHAIEEAQQLLLRAEVRCVTLSGPPGTGKTRLALAVAASAAGSFAHGVCFVPLGSVHDAELVVASIAQGLGLLDAAPRDVERALEDHLRDKHFLLILDNFEHLTAAAPAVAGLLGACTQLKILVTSRVRLRVYGEHVYPVPPLTLPSWPLQLGADLPAELGRSEAVRLFVERAQAIRPGFALDVQSAAAVAEICARLDGLPLAIELAAARLRALTPQMLLAGLDRRLSLLTGGPPDLPARQQTLRDALASSYELLRPSEQRLLRCLGVFAGGWTLAAAGGCAGLDERTLLEGTAALIDNSLIVLKEPEGAADAAPRYAMLETIREFALEQLAAGGEDEAVHEAHADWAKTLAETAPTGLCGPDQLPLLAQLDNEHDNLRAALQWLAERARTRGDAIMAERGLRLAGALARFWYLRGHFSEGRRWLADLVAAADTAGAGGKEQSAAYGRAQAAAGLLAWSQGDYAAARVSYERALGVARARGDKTSVAAALHGLGQVMRRLNDPAEARRCYAQALELRQEVADQWGVADTLYNLGHLAAQERESEAAYRLYRDSMAIWERAGDRHGVANCTTYLGLVAYFLNDLVRARRLCERGLAAWREAGDRRGTAEALRYFAMVLHAQGDDAVARSLLEESLEIRRTIGEQSGVAESIFALGELALDQGEFHRAAALLQESLSRHRELGSGHMVAVGLIHLAGVAAATHERVRAARLLGAADALLGTTGSTLWPGDERRRRDVDAALRSALGDAPFEAARIQGAGWSLDTAVDYAVDPDLPLPAPAGRVRAAAPAGSRPHGTLLTKRELTVVRLVTQGLTNREIASRLVITERTAATHLEHILTKLGVRSRTQIAAWATRYGATAAGN